MQQDKHELDSNSSLGMQIAKIIAMHHKELLSNVAQLKRNNSLTVTTLWVMVKLYFVRLAKDLEPLVKR